MTDEEKKSIEIIKFLQDKCIQENGTGMMPIYRINDLANAIKILLNLIEKQSKEIEELKEKNKLLGVISLSFKEIQDRDKKWEDKIKAKIEEVKDGTFDAKIVLQSLLEKE